MTLADTVARDARGIALPLALLSLLLFTSLALALLAVAQTEPTIASNHLRAVQARALADSALAYATWALGETGAVPGAGEPLPLGPTGAFAITIAGADPHVRVVRAVGASGAGARVTVVATLARVRELAREAPCALCVGAPVALAGSTADARGSETTECGAKAGVQSAGGVTFDATAGAYGGGAPPGTPARVDGRDWREHERLAIALSADQLQTLKALAVVRGRYLRPASGARLPLDDADAGLVFVDTPAGTAITTGNLANVELGAARFRGWLVVNGNLRLGAGADVEGLLYAVNAIDTDGPATVTGIAVAHHVLGGASRLSGLALRFDCAAARFAAAVPRGWFVRPGTYCDGSAGC